MRTRPCTRSSIASSVSPTQERAENLSKPVVAAKIAEARNKRAERTELSQTAGPARHRHPELNTYSVWVEVEDCFDVKARSEEEIRDLIEEGWVPADELIGTEFLQLAAG